MVQTTLCACLVWIYIFAHVNMSVGGLEALVWSFPAVAWVAGAHEYPSDPAKTVSWNKKGTPVTFDLLPLYILVIKEPSNTCCPLPTITMGLLLQLWLLAHCLYFSLAKCCLLLCLWACGWDYSCWSVSVFILKISFGAREGDGLFLEAIKVFFFCGDRFACLAVCNGSSDSLELTYCQQKDFWLVLLQWGNPDFKH